GAFSRTPHPTGNVVVGGTEHNDGTTWDTHEVWWFQNDDTGPNGEVAKWFNGTLILWLTNMWNTGTGLQGMSRIDLGGYAPTAGTIEDYRNFQISYTRPAGRGI